MNFKSLQEKMQKRKEEIEQQIVEKKQEIVEKNQEIEDIKSSFEMEKNTHYSALQVAFQQKYGEDFQKVLVEYCLFVLHPKRCNFTIGHRIHMPIVVYGTKNLPRGYFSYVRFSKPKYDIQWGPIEGYVTVVDQEYYQECIPIQKIKDAYACIGFEGELISPCVETIPHGTRSVIFRWPT